MESSLKGSADNLRSGRLTVCEKKELPSQTFDTTLTQVAHYCIFLKYISISDGSNPIRLNV